MEKRQFREQHKACAFHSTTQASHSNSSLPQFSSPAKFSNIIFLFIHKLTSKRVNCMSTQTKSFLEKQISSLRNEHEVWSMNVCTTMQHGDALKLFGVNLNNNFSPCFTLGRIILFFFPFQRSREKVFYLVYKRKYNQKLSLDIKFWNCSSCFSFFASFPNISRPNINLHAEV